MKLVYILVLIVIAAGIWSVLDKEPEQEVMIKDETDSAMEAEESAMEVKEGEAMVGESKEFTIDSFKFGYSETEIRVKKGDTVTINLTNSDGLHDWVVDEFSAATEQILEGGVTSVTFVASETGTFEYYCSVGTHRELGMVGNLIVE